jgi:hypothetical protein
MSQPDNLIKVYAECSNGYHKIDDFRAKLLGFLPLASATGIFGTLYIDSKSVMPGNHIALGLFGVLATVGLLIYELKGILKCTQFIFLGKWIEGVINEDIYPDDSKQKGLQKVPGFFTELSEPIFMPKIVVEPVASAFIYSTVLAAWVYIILLKTQYWKWLIPLIAFSIIFVGIYVYWRKVYNKIEEIYMTKDA